MFDFSSYSRGMADVFLKYVSYHNNNNNNNNNNNDNNIWLAFYKTLYLSEVV